MALCLLLTSNAFALKMGKVDVQKILVTVKESASIREKLKKEFDKKQKEIRDEEQKIVKEQEDFKKKAALLNDKKKAEKAQELQQRVMTLQRKMQKYQSEMQKMENKFKATKTFPLPVIFLSHKSISLNLKRSISNCLIIILCF